MNASDSVETLDNIESFLKGGTMTAVLNDVINCTKLEKCVENKNGWWNTVKVESKGKLLAIKTVHRIVDANVKRAN